MLDEIAVAPESAPAHIQWFTEARFGLFIHWGLYSLPARHEWVRSVERLSAAEYRRYFDHFYPDLFDPESWAHEAWQAGMRYVVLTTKHHDGFCLWDSAFTDYKAPASPWGKDLLTPFVEAFRARGFRIGFYHSLIDWHHPEFPVDGHHPLRDDHAAREEARDISVYREYLHGQTRELLTQFGRIDVMWFDFSYPQTDWGWTRGKGKDDWNSEKLVKMVRELQPGIIVNDRLDEPGDFATPEQYQPVHRPTREGAPIAWEACHTLTGSWGYHRDNDNWKSSEMLVRMLVDTISKGGNLLLNVGPTGRGELESKAVDRLREIGAWMRLHGRSIYGCTASSFPPPPDCRYTQSGNRLYLHLFAWPIQHVHLEGLAGKVEYAQLLNDASEITMHVHESKQHPHAVMTSGPTPGSLTLELPIRKPPVAVPVIEFFLKDET